MKGNKKDIRKQIDSYIKGALSEDEILNLWAEFAKNPALLDELELEVGVKKIIEEKALGKQNSTLPKIFHLPSWTLHVAAASVLLLVAMTQFFQIESKTELSQFVARSIAHDQMETGDDVGSREVAIPKADSLLNLGFSTIISGNTSQALTLYNEVIENYDFEPYGSKAYTNKGILLYNEGNYAASIEAFDSVLVRVNDSQRVEEKAYWFKGNALTNILELQEARMAVMQAYSLNGVFRKPAFLLLQKLNYDMGYIDYENLERQIDN